MRIEEMTIEQLEEIARRMPKTADGAIVVPGMVVYNTVRCVDGWWTDVEERNTSVCVETLDYEDTWSECFSDCYSTRAAAEAARKDQP